MRKKKLPIDALRALQKLKGAAIDKSPPPNLPADMDDLGSVEGRAHRLFETLNKPHRKPGQMLFFVMYDIESDKVRRHVAKYLERMGCWRVQRSIFLADIDAAKYHQIRDDLTEVQSLYDNTDSILICPVSTELIKNMKIIGQNINLDLITHTKNTLFF